MRYQQVQLLNLALLSAGVYTDAEKVTLRGCLEGARLSAEQSEWVAGPFASGAEGLVARFRPLRYALDLKAPVAKCQLCGHVIRYIFFLQQHEDGRAVGQAIDTGSDCIGTYVDAAFKRQVPAMMEKARVQARKEDDKLLVERAWQATGKGDSIRAWIKSVAEGFKRYGSLTVRQREGLERVIAVRAGKEGDRRGNGNGNGNRNRTGAVGPAVPHLPGRRPV